MTSLNTTIGTRIRLLRKALGLSQTDLAERVGVCFQQVQKYENGKTTISASRLQQISDALGVSILMLLRDPETMPDQGEDCAGTA